MLKSSAMSQKTMSRVSNNYYELIQNNVRGNIMKDPLFICTECGRLKSTDVELSGTLCSTCSTTNLTLDAKIKRFTSMVKLIHLDNVSTHGGFQTANDKENFTVFDFKSPKPRIKSRQQNEESAQTDLSFHPMDDVTFVIKHKHSNKKVLPLKGSSKVENNELRVSSDSQFSQTNTEKLHSAQKVRTKSNLNRDINELKGSNGSQSSQGNTLQSAQALFKNNDLGDIAEKPSRHQAPDSGPEMIESSVDDWLMPRQIPSSPILFSPEAKGEESDIDECVDATPVKETKERNEDEQTDQTIRPVEQDRMSDSEEEIGNTRMEKANGAENAIEVDNHTETEEDGSSGNDMNAIGARLLEIETERKDVDEEQLLTQVVGKVSKHNVNLVISSVEGDEFAHLDAFVELFNPVVDSDVNQHTDFLIVGVDSENKVLKRTPKFLKAISLHTCIVNTEYIQKCCLQNDIVPLEKRFIPLDSSGVSGPLRSIVRPDQQLLSNFVFFSLERSPSLSSLIESLILHNGGKIIVNIKLFNAYDSADESVGDGKRVGTPVRKVLVYGDNEEEQLTTAYKAKVYMAFKCQCFHYKSLFNVIAGYDLEEFEM